MTAHQGPVGDERWFASRAAGRPARRPNVVFILADDLGWADLGCYGSDEITTPNLDRLAAQGVRFTHAYASSPWCSPTRIALYTGRYPGRLPAGLEEPLQTRTDGMGIPHDHPTLASLLVDAGYETAMFGKWHCGFMPWYSPMRSGYQRFYGCIDGAIDYHEHIGTLGEPDLWDGETPVVETGYFTDMISARAAEYVAAERDAPFYLQLNYTAPHWPWEGRDDAAVGARIRADYEAQAAPNALPLFHHDGGSLDKYRQLVETMDEGIGVVLDALDRAGRTDNTVVCFASDNGGERWSRNWPFIGEKGDLTEGGIRVPFILRWPAAVDPRQVCAEPHLMLDWTATILDAAGTGPHPDHPLDGPSLLSWLVDGAAYPAHDLYWRISSQSAIRRGDHKLLVSQRPEAFSGNWPLMHHTPFEHLYDVTVDGREAAELRDRNPEIVDELRASLAALDAAMLPYPADHPGLPRRAVGTRPAISQPD
ncbi:MAG: sulfatase-like hydrolase/transferase [Desertimonas sp.]